MIRDLALLWILILVFILALLFGGASSRIQDKETMITSYGGSGLLLAFGVVMTILQLTGKIPVW